MEKKEDGEIEVTTTSVKSSEQHEDNEDAMSVRDDEVDEEIKQIMSSSDLMNMNEDEQDDLHRNVNTSTTTTTTAKANSATISKKKKKSSNDLKMITDDGENDMQMPSAKKQAINMPSKTSKN